MLVEVEKVGSFDWSPFPVAQIQTPIGRTAAQWCGPPAIGPHHVEWTVNTEITWGANANPANDPTPAIRPSGDDVILRGRLQLTPDGAGVLDLAGSPILLDLTEQLPAEADASWVQIQVPRKDIQLYPVNL